MNGGEGGIRTPDTLSGMPVFKTGAINHSATSPLGRINNFGKHLTYRLGHRWSHHQCHLAQCPWQFAGQLEERLGYARFRSRKETVLLALRFLEHHPTFSFSSS
jgi:hypothetical protein